MGSFCLSSSTAVLFTSLSISSVHVHLLSTHALCSTQCQPLSEKNKADFRAKMPNKYVILSMCTYLWAGLKERKGLFLTEEHKHTHCNSRRGYQNTKHRRRGLERGPVHWAKLLPTKTNCLNLVHSSSAPSVVPPSLLTS